MAAALLEDTLQKPGKHEAKNGWWASHGVPVTRVRLPYGDYVRAPSVSIDTKNSIAELCIDVSTDHERFRAECERAKADGCRLVVLVENKDGIGSIEQLPSWVEPAHEFKRRAKHGAKRRWSGKWLAASCSTMTERYGVVFLFCAPDEAARIVCEILGVPFTEGVGEDGAHDAT